MLYKISQSTIIKKSSDLREGLNRHVTKENSQKSSSTRKDMYVYWMFGKIDLKHSTLLCISKNISNTKGLMI